MKKERQHHVWQHYLKSWANEDGQVFCLSDGRIFSTGTNVLAVERDFYKLSKTTPEDIKLLRWLIVDNATPDAKRMHEKFLAMMTFPMDFVEANRRQLNNLNLIEESLDEYMTNALEDEHMGIEGRFLPHLERIKNGDLSFYSDSEGCLDFLMFISAQYMRTKGIKVRSIQSIKEKNGKDLSRIWSLMSSMYATNIMTSLFFSRKVRKLVLIENLTGLEFITGDQPAINLLGTPPLPPESLSIYYPISPKLAIILAEDNQAPMFTTETLTAKDVAELNGRIVAASHSQVFANTEAALKPFNKSERE